MKIITFASKKGGVSKTTSCIFTGLILSESSRVLLIDADSQNALTSFFFSDLGAIKGKTIYEAVRGLGIFEKSIHKISENLSVMPCVPEFDEIEHWTRTGKELILRNELRKLDYDYILIDTPPTTGAAMVMACTAADEIIVPARLEQMDIRAIGATIEKIKNEIRPSFNPGLKKIRILPTQYNFQNRTVHDLSMEDIQETYPGEVLELKIPYSSKISQINYAGYDGKKIGIEEYRKLVEVLK